MLRVKGYPFSKFELEESVHSIESEMNRTGVLYMGTGFSLFCEREQELKLENIKCHNL